MEENPLEILETGEEHEHGHGHGGGHKELSEADRRKAQLNTLVAITITLLATFGGISKAREHGIAAEMSQAQSKSVDTWAWYQAKKTRLAVAEGISEIFANQKATAEAEKYHAKAEKENKDTEEVKAKAEEYDKEYEHLHARDELFDLSEALLAVAIAMFAVTTLTQKRWLYFVALVPGVFGLLYGLAGLFNLHLGVLGKIGGV